MGTESSAGEALERVRKLRRKESVDPLKLRKILKQKKARLSVVDSIAYIQPRRLEV